MSTVLASVWGLMKTNCTAKGMLSSILGHDHPQVWNECPSHCCVPRSQLVPDSECTWPVSWMNEWNLPSHPWSTWSGASSPLGPQKTAEAMPRDFSEGKPELPKWTYKKALSPGGSPLLRGANLVLHHPVPPRCYSSLCPDVCPALIRADSPSPFASLRCNHWLPPQKTNVPTDLPRAGWSPWLARLGVALPLSSHAVPAPHKKSIAKAEIEIRCKSGLGPRDSCWELRRADQPWNHQIAGFRDEG